MTLKELNLEIQKGDLINERYYVNKITNSYAISFDHKDGEQKFSLKYFDKKYAQPIQTVSRDGKIYYRKLPHGGKR